MKIRRAFISLMILAGLLVIPFHAAAAPEELITNGGFEKTEAWVIGSTPVPATYTTERSHSGNRSMLMGIVPSLPNRFSYSSIRQVVTIPSNAVGVTLSFWYYPISQDTGFDYQMLALLDPSGVRPLEVLWRAKENAQTWQHKSFDLTRYRGQTITVYFNVFNDGCGCGTTAMYLDDVSLHVWYGATPTPTPLPVIRFWVDESSITQGECTKLHWHVENVSAIYLDGAPVTGPDGEQEVCPTSTTTYTLHVVKLDGSTEDRTLTVSVMPPGAATPTPTETSTPTSTPTPTETSTPTSTPTETLTPTETSTSTSTPTETPTSTLTPTGTLTPVPTPTATPAPTGVPMPAVPYPQFPNKLLILGSLHIFLLASLLAVAIVGLLRWR